MKMTTVQRVDSPLMPLDGRPDAVASPERNPADAAKAPGFVGALNVE